MNILGVYNFSFFFLPLRPHQVYTQKRNLHSNPTIGLLVVRKIHIKLTFNKGIKINKYMDIEFLLGLDVIETKFLGKLVCIDGKIMRHPKESIAKSPCSDCRKFRPPPP